MCTAYETRIFRGFIVFGLMVKPPLEAETLQQLRVGGGPREKHIHPHICIDIFCSVKLSLCLSSSPPPIPPPLHYIIIREIFNSYVISITLLQQQYLFGHVVVYYLKGRTVFTQFIYMLFIQWLIKRQCEWEICGPAFPPTGPHRMFSILKIYVLLVQYLTIVIWRTEIPPLPHHRTEVVRVML
jgi:hypothetical protein